MPTYEIEVIPGLEPFVVEEVQSAIPGAAIRERGREGRISVRFHGDLAGFQRLRTAVAVHAVETFEIPRPRALLGHEHFSRIVATAVGILKLHLPPAFQTIKISAAGEDSAVFGRLRAELCAALTLRPALPGEDGDLLLSVRPAPGPATGWQVLVRLSPKPLSARAWRTCNLPGAVNATVARVMARLTEPAGSDRFLNLACGSATLLVERHELGDVALAVGCDLDPKALACAHANLNASGHRWRTHLLRADATRLPFESAMFDATVVDLPYGMLVNPPGGVRTLYPALLQEAARVTNPNGCLVAITARTGWLEDAIEAVGPLWATSQVVPIKVPYRSGVFAAQIFVLCRSAR